MIVIAKGFSSLTADYYIGNSFLDRAIGWKKIIFVLNTGEKKYQESMDRRNGPAIYHVFIPHNLTLMTLKKKPFENIVSTFPKTNFNFSITFCCLPNLSIWTSPKMLFGKESNNIENVP